jgi:hypothetical protein
MCHFPFQSFFHPSRLPLSPASPKPIPIYCCFYAGIANESSSSFPSQLFFVAFLFFHLVMPFPNKGS